MKRILFFIEDSSPGGAQKILISILDSLNREKYGAVVGLLREGWLFEQLRSKGYEVIILDSTGKSFDWKLIGELLKLCRGFNVTLIHTHLFDSGLYACLAGIFSRLPIIITLHGEVDWKKKSNSIIDGIKRVSINLVSNRIVYVSQGLRQYYENLGFSKEKSVVIYNGIDLNYFTPVEGRKVGSQLGLSSYNVLIGAVGHVKSWKGYEYMIEAAEIVNKQFPEAQFLIAGAFDKRDRYYQSVKEMVKERKLEKHILFLGYQNDIKEILTALNLFVLPSITEGFSLSLVEAMAMGVPVVATRSGGPEEIVIDGKTGFLVPPGKPKKMAEKILVLLENIELRREMGERGRELVSDKFSIKAMVENYEKLYDKVIIEYWNRH